MKFQQTTSLFLGALAICFGTLAFTRTSDAQTKIGGTNGSTLSRLGLGSSVNELKKSPNGSAANGESGEPITLTVDDKYVWATQGATIYRIERDSLGVQVVPLRPTSESPAGLKGVVSRPGGVGTILKSGGGGG